ncbi:hypothetical protein C8Q75DRAFT_94965 [Abortiporus biennis]|nr:hypothetical protein C8Q75DRAFT_94965 [Abortiporus biennis]
MPKIQYYILPSTLPHFFFGTTIPLTPVPKIKLPQEIPMTCLKISAPTASAVAVKNIREDP